MKGAIVIAILGFAGLAAAYCPNACSGHGTCGAWDKCACYGNWQGIDCSQRTCAFGFAWVDTPAEDSDATAAAHNYAECSNKGLCDRKSGLCKCFDGYEGKACRRSTCPNDCSGHGTCEYIEELSFDKISEHGEGTAHGYSQWDQSKIQGCKCDVGYDGPDCSARLCPRGDDPLTHLAADTDAAIVNEVQVVEILNDDNTFAGTDSFALIFSDLYGGHWTTRPIAAEVYDADQGAAAAVKAALQGLPNKVIEEVTVTEAAGTCKNGGAYVNAATDEACADTWTACAVGDCANVFLITFSGAHNSGDQKTLRCLKDVQGAGSMPVLGGLGTGGACTVGTATTGNDESAVCANRGECDSSTGLCECHEGYTDEDCSVQQVFV